MIISFLQFLLRGVGDFCHICHLQTEYKTIDQIWEVLKETVEISVKIREILDKILLLNHGQTPLHSQLIMEYVNNP